MRIFCSKCNNFWRGSPFVKSCIVPKGKRSSWLRPNEEIVSRNNPSVKNANNDCKDFIKSVFWHKMASICSAYFGGSR